MAQSRLTETSAFQVQALLPASASQVAELRGMHHQAWPIFLFFLRQSFTLSPRMECSDESQLTATSASRVQAILLPWPLEQLELQMCAYAQLIFCIFSRDGISP